MMKIQTKQQKLGPRIYVSFSWINFRAKWNKRETKNTLLNKILIITSHHHYSDARTHTLTPCHHHQQAIMFAMFFSSLMFSTSIEAKLHAHNPRNDYDETTIVIFFFGGKSGYDDGPWSALMKITLCFVISCSSLLSMVNDDQSLMDIPFSFGGGREIVIGNLVDQTMFCFGVESQ